MLTNTTLVGYNLGYVEGLGIYDSWENFVKHKVTFEFWLEGHKEEKEFIKTVSKVANLCLLLGNEADCSCVVVRTTRCVWLPINENLSNIWRKQEGITIASKTFCLSSFLRVLPLKYKKHKAIAKQKRIGLFVSLFSFQRYRKTLVTILRYTRDNRKMLMHNKKNVFWGDYDMLDKQLPTHTQNLLKF